MRLRLALLALAIPASAINILLTNDDGWAEINIRTFYNALTAAGDSVVLSAPAENESGTGISSALDPRSSNFTFPPPCRHLSSTNFPL